MLVMIPVAHDDSKFFVVRMGFFRWMQGYWCAKTVHVLTLQKCEDNTVNIQA